LDNTSLSAIRFFRDKYIEGTGRILAVGSKDINGSCRGEFPGWEYIGCDLDPGKNVDVVIADPYNWSEFPGHYFDVVISCSAFEHMEYPWLAIKEIERVARNLVAIVVPQDCPEHKCPLDCYRYYPDGLRALAKWAGLKVLEVYRTKGEKWTTCLMVAKKSPYTRGMRTPNRE